MVDIKKLKELTQQLDILYVEDDLSIQKTMSRYLNKFFSLVDVANNGEEALKLYAKNSYDIIITDLSMPKINGINMIQEIKKIEEEQAILITTAHGEANFLLEALKAHIDGYIIKPFDYDALNFELFKVSQKIVKFKENEEYKNHLQEMLLEQTKEMSTNYEKTIYSMVDLIEQRDTYTAGHSKRVAHYCQLIAKNMHYSDEECTLIHQAGILHDVGKIETPDAVLLNPKKLNEIEYKLIQEHVTVGYNLLKNIPMFQPLAKIIYEHHERYDGSGYPNKLQGNQIHKLARIMILADAFDAMTTNRIYQARKTVQEALDELKELSKKQFHPEVVESALIALKEIKIDENINQLPKTQLEEERFAYFYKDFLSHAYNQNYLDVVLMKNSYKLDYLHMVIFSIKNFSNYNKLNSWEKGDKFLKEFGNILCTYFKEALVFRIFGDDFVVMSKGKVNVDKVTRTLYTLVQKHNLTYKISEINLEKIKIQKLTDIELLQNK